MFKPGRKTSDNSELNKRLWDLLSLHNTNRIDYNTRKWETVKFFQTVITALLAATVATMYALSGKQGITLLWRISAILPFISAISSYLAIKNLSRESRLLFIEEVQMFKIARLIGLDISVPETKRWVPDDDKLLPLKWTDPTFRANPGNVRGWWIRIWRRYFPPKDRRPARNIDEWLDRRMKGHVFHNIFVWLFIAECFCSIALIGVLFLENPVAVPDHTPEGAPKPTPILSTSLLSHGASVKAHRK